MHVTDRCMTHNEDCAWMQNVILQHFNLVPIKTAVQHGLHDTQFLNTDFTGDLFTLHFLMNTEGGKKNQTWISETLHKYTVQRSEFGQYATRKNGKKWESKNCWC